MASPQEMAQTMRNNIEIKTGKAITEWFDIIAKSTLEKHGQIVSMLKKDHAVTHGFANLISSDFLKQDQAAENEMDLIDAQYSGNKADLKLIYLKIIECIKHFDEMEIAPKKSYVSLRRNKQFALIQASTKTRIDLGINLKDCHAGNRLEDSGSFNSMVSHRVRITDISQIDTELIAWLDKAYQQS
jgi:hypothetical protein